MLKNIFHKIRKKLIRFRLQPIRVFCFHQVSETFDPNVYCKPDWISLDVLQSKVNSLRKEGYNFISLKEAYNHIQHDIIRTHKYAVITADDGLKCHAEIIPWLEKQNTPITLFVNIETLFNLTCNQPMKEHFQIENDEDNKKHAEILFMQLKDLVDINSPILSIGLHGFDHTDVKQYSVKEFNHSVNLCIKELCPYLDIIPYYAYTYGTHTIDTDQVLWNMNFIPVLIDGAMNYNDKKYIHRELIK